MRFAKMLVAASVLAVAGSAFGAAGTAYNYTGIANQSTSSTSTFYRVGSAALTGSPSTATWVSYTFRANITGGSAVSTIVSLTGSTGTTANTGSNSSGAPASSALGGAPVYYNGAGSATSPSSGVSLLANIPLTSTFPGGSSPLSLWVRNANASSTYSNISLTLYTAATADITGSVDKTGATVKRPTAYAGQGTPSQSSTDVYYGAPVPFYVGADGTYIISGVGPASNTNLSGAIYSATFNPSNTAANLVRANQSSFSGGTQPLVGGALAPSSSSGFNSITTDASFNTTAGVALTAGTQYYYVPFLTTFGSAATVSLYSDGPSTVTWAAIPEPSALGLVAAGLPMLMRRRRSK